MDHNAYVVEWYARHLLEAARDEARRHALIPPRPPIMRSMLVAGAAALVRLSARWSAPASTGSKPGTARA